MLIRVRLPVFLGSLEVTAQYPAYLGLEAEPVPTGGDTLLLPAGTRLETRGEVTAPLAGAVWRNGGRCRVAAGERAAGSPGASRRFARARTSWRLSPGAAPRSRAIRCGCRSAWWRTARPQVDMPVPGADTLAPLSLKLPLVLDVRDDHGFTAVTVESRRISRLGVADSARRESVPLPNESTDRAILTYTLDLTRRGLLPGDTVRYRAIAIDNAPAGSARPVA